MLTLDLKSLGRQRRLIIQYLNSQSDESARVQGTKVTFKSLKARTAKVLVRRFLHQNGMGNYRVVIVEPNLLRVVKQGTKKHAYRKQPFLGAPRTIPEYQVAASIDGSIPIPGERKWKP